MGEKLNVLYGDKLRSTLGPVSMENVPAAISIFLQIIKQLLPYTNFINIEYVFGDYLPCLHRCLGLKNNFQI